MRRFEDVYAGKPGFYYQIHRDSVLACDPEKFIETFDVERIAAAGRLRELRGIVHVGINGWDDDERALHEIPEVRAYIQRLDREYPFLAYALTTKSDALKTISLCLVPTSMTRRDDTDGARFAATFDTHTYHQILQRWFRDFDRACAMARGFSRLEHGQMTAELAEYFGVEWYLK